MSRAARIRNWPRIRVVERKSKTVWEVDTGFVVVPRIRKKFDDENIARAFAEKLRIQRINEGLNSFGLNDSQRRDAREALALLKDHSITLKDAAQFYCRHAKVASLGKQVKEVWEELLDFKEHVQKKRPAYLHDLRCRLRHFVDEFADRSVADLTAPEIQAWLYRDQSISGLTRRNYYALLSVFFSFAQGKRDRRKPTAAPYRLDNPMESVPRPQFDVEPPEILTVAETRLLLAKAKATQPTHGMLPYVVLGLFCGVRAAELSELEWGDLSFRKQQVTISARIAKKRRLRNIPIPANALKWLKPFKCSEGKIAPRGCARNLSLLAKEAGLANWPQNGLRHSFGSYFFALTGNGPETAARLGHKGDDVLFEHYRALADRHDAKVYFSLSP